MRYLKINIGKIIFNFYVMKVKYNYYILPTIMFGNMLKIKTFVIIIHFLNFNTGFDISWR